MIVNHAGALKKEYFIPYLNLIMNARNCDLEHAREIAFAFFFKNNKNLYGHETYNQFLLAYEELRER